jgi:enamine deaminase RidA (YjgF/YER057c/UK114 family)
MWVMEAQDEPRTRISSASPFAEAIGFSAAVRAGDDVWVAGMTAVAPDGEVVGSGDPYAQAVEALRKAGEALAAAGASLEDVVKTTMFLTRREHWEAVGRAHGEAFARARPAATMVVCELLSPAMLVEVEVVARVRRR